MTDVTPTALLMARDACAAMSEQQRIALAIELIAPTTQPSSAFHLMRLENLSRDISTGLLAMQFARDCG